MENATINRELSALKRMFNLGIEAEKIYHKPHIAMLKESNVRKGFFEYAEFVAVRDTCPDYFKPVVTFAYYTGWRKEEILSLLWNQVDLPAEEIRLHAGETKNDDGRVIMLDGELLETLQAQWERRKVAEIPGHSPALLSRYVFHRNGKKIGGKGSDIRDWWRKACVGTKCLNDKGEEVLLGQMVEIERKGKKVMKYVGKYFHDFRRTSCRDNIRAGIPEKVAMQLSGHKTRSVFSRYNIVSNKDLKAAGIARSAYVREQEEKVNKVAFFDHAKKA